VMSSYMMKLAANITVHAWLEDLPLLINHVSSTHLYAMHVELIEIILDSSNVQILDI